MLPFSFRGLGGETKLQGSFRIRFEFRWLGGKIDLRMLRCDGWETCIGTPGTVRGLDFSFFFCKLVVGSIAAECRQRSDLRWTTDECYLCYGKWSDFTGETRNMETIDRLIH